MFDVSEFVCDYILIVIGEMIKRVCVYTQGHNKLPSLIIDAYAFPESVLTFQRLKSEN